MLSDARPLPKGVRILPVRPGALPTPLELWRKELPEEQRAAMRKSLPRARWQPFVPLNDQYQVPFACAASSPPSPAAHVICRL